MTLAANLTFYPAWMSAKVIADSARLAARRVQDFMCQWFNAPKGLVCRI
jgi:hypothetical protein